MNSLIYIYVIGKFKPVAIPDKNLPITNAGSEHINDMQLPDIANKSIIIRAFLLLNYCTKFSSADPIAYPIKNIQFSIPSTTSIYYVDMNRTI